jgi:exonuclease SbcC
MRPLHLKLQGFHGIRSGLNRDTLELDLKAAKGLVALTGPNGIGKTTVLESLQPYRVMPFRAGGYTPRTFSYYDHVAGDGLKELTWEHAGRIYRSGIKIKGAGKTKKQECYLHVANAEGDPWQPVTLPDGTVSDGKTETYDQCVEYVLGAPELFFTACFAAQSRRHLSDYAPAEIKTLLSDLLGLEALLAMGRRADESAKHVAARYEAQRAAITGAATIDGQIAEYSAQLQAAEETRATVEHGRAQARQAAAQASAHLANIRAKLANMDELLRRRAALETELGRVQTERDAALRQHETIIAHWQERAACTSLQADLSGLEARLAQVQRSRDEYQHTIATAPNTDTVAAEIAKLIEERTAVDEKLASARAALEKVRALQSDLALARERLAAVKRDGLSVKEQAEAAERRAKLTEEVPCASLPEINAACGLLKDAHGAKALAAELTERLVVLRQQHTEAREKVDALEQQIAAAGEDGAQTNHQALEARRKALEVDLTEAHRQQSAAAAARQAQIALDAAAAEITALENQFSAKRALIERERKEAESALATATADHDTVRQNYQERITALQSEIETLPKDPAKNGLGEAEAAARAAENALAEADSAVLRTATDIAGIKASLHAAEDRRAGLEAQRCAAEAAADDLAQWKLLAKALGRDGIVALIIDDAGPAISGIANDLLTTCYGPRFAIRMDTQEETKTGTLKESFDIRVFDAERDDDKSVSLMSGGERIWIEAALTRAIALYRAQTAGRSYECLFSDESDGALDPDRKEMFGRMKRRVLEIGEYHAEFFVSHTRELWAIADHVIDLAALRQETIAA